MKVNPDTAYVCYVVNHVTDGEVSPIDHLQVVLGEIELRGWLDTVSADIKKVGLIVEPTANPEILRVRTADGYPVSEIVTIKMRKLIA